MKKKQENNRDVIDLSSINYSSSATELKYICKQDKELLQPYPQGQIENPYAGPCYRCPTCNTVYDSSLVKLPRQPRPVNSSIGDNNNTPQVIFETISEDNIKGLSEPEDEYDKFNPDNDDEIWKGQGATITDSRIELVDSSGMNRTIVKRNS